MISKMKTPISLLCLLLSLSAIQTSPQSSLQVLQSALSGIYQQNALPLQIALQTCMNESTAQTTSTFISQSLLKAKTGTSSQIVTLIDDLHAFYLSLDPSIALCLNSNDSLLKLTYKYGISYLPLAQQQFRNYTKSNYLRLHQRFGEIHQKWTSQQYEQSAYLLALYAHQLFPIVKKDIRGIWLTNVASTALDSPQNIQQTVRICSQAHINTIFVVVYNNARTIYPSKVMESLIGIKQQEKFVGRDPLQELITAAQNYGIEVHAWFEYGFSSSYNAEGGPIIANRPQWKALNVDGKLVNKNGFDWLNGFDPQVQQFMLDLFTQVISNYNIDGVQGDDRLPALPSTAGYQPYTIQLYQQEHGGELPPSNYLDQNWIVWRMNKLSDFMKRLYFQSKRLKPSIMVTAAPSPFPWSKYEYLQDWPSWAKYGWIDAVIPQCYRYNITAYQNVLQQQMNYLPNDKLIFASGVLLNVGDYVANTSFLAQMVNLNRNMGTSGESFFYYEGVFKQIEWFHSSYGRKDGDLTAEQ